jgi:hypothetical protein
MTATIEAASRALDRNRLDKQTIVNAFLAAAIVDVSGGMPNVRCAATQTSTASASSNNLSGSPNRVKLGSAKLAAGNAVGYIADFEPPEVCASE